MNDSNDKLDPDIEAMLSGLATTDDERSALLEEHRQLEKDLLRLADPLPPPDFLQQVMQKVAQAPAPAPARSEVALAAAITLGALTLGAMSFFSTGGIGGLGLAFTNVLLRVREAAIGLGSAFEVVWRTQALPVAMVLGVMLVCCVLALKKLGTEAKVTT